MKSHENRITELESRVAELEDKVFDLVADKYDPDVHHVAEEYKCSCCGNTWKGIGDIDDGICDKCKVLNLPAKSSQPVEEQ